MSDAIPQDFPIEPLISALAGAQAKLAVAQAGGKFHAPGTTPEEALRQYELCEDLAQQLAAYCSRKLAQQTVSSEHAALERALRGLRQKTWCSPRQKMWVMRRTARLLGWQEPAHWSDRSSLA